MITIIIPVYKKEKYLKKCLENIKHQSYNNWKVIVVNDGSDMPHKIDEIAKSTLGAKCRVIHQVNKGVSNARNTGIKSANTEYIMTLDPDDLLHKNYLSKIMLIFEKNNSDIVFSWVKVQGHINSIIDTRVINIFNLLRRNLIVCASPFRKSVWTKVGGFDESMKSGYEDWEFWIRTCLADCKFTSINEILFYYNTSNTGVNYSATIHRVDNIHYIRKKHREIYTTSLITLIRNPIFFNIPIILLIYFWVTNVFFICLPRSLRVGIFEIYRKFQS